MSDIAQLRGVIPVPVTPFDADEGVVLEDVRRQVEAAVRFGLKGICLPAYAGEFYKLSEGERLEVVEAAVDASEGRIAVFAQCNHPSAKQVAETAVICNELGADGISFAIPRQFGVPARDLTDYCRRICEATDLPVLIQDFNPGGPSVGADFCASLADACSTFRYVKLEEPMLGAKLRAIREATEDRIGVLAGWGGMYTPELLEQGLAGVMPGLGAADLLQLMFERGTKGDMDSALDLFEGVLPQIVFSLQSIELFLATEKMLLEMRGIIRHTTVRSLKMTLAENLEAHARRLNERLMEEMEVEGLAVRPLG